MLSKKLEHGVERALLALMVFLLSVALVGINCCCINVTVVRFCSVR